MDEVKNHSTKQDAWCAIDGLVYDMTKYIPMHPGGLAKIMKGAGKEASEVFHKSHLNLDILTTPLRSKIIGVLVENRKDQTWTGKELQKPMPNFLDPF
jgi:cytochrome b involved in lipid metabolism